MAKVSGKLKIAAAALLAVTAVAAMPLVTQAASGDIVTVPDAALKSALITAADADSSGTLTEGELAALIGALDLSGKGIYDITGLEFVTSVTSLDLSDNRVRDISAISGLALTELDVSQNYLDLTPGGEDMQNINALLDRGCSMIYASQKAIAVEGVSLDRTSFVGCANDTFKLTATVSPTDAADKAVTWSSGNAEIATVSNGTVTILSAGTVSITATTADANKTAACAVTVKGDKLSSPKYIAADGRLTGVAKSTALPVFKTNFNNDEADIKVYKADGGEITRGLAGTGMTAKLFVGGKERDSVAVIVNGDSNGDGNISISDYTLARLDILGLKALSGSYRIGADVNRDGKISISDYTLMRLDILGLKPIGGGLPDLPEVANSKIRRFLDIALAQQGDPYVWGDEGPSSFDCSGLVHYCLNQAGYSVGRSTAHTYSLGRSGWTRVDKSALQPGDLMFFFSDNPSDGDHIGHTGIYLGNGYLIHASSSNGFVIISQKRGWYETMLSHGMRVNF